MKALKFGVLASLVLVAILGINGCKKGLGDNKEIKRLPQGRTCLGSRI